MTDSESKSGRAGCWIWILGAYEKLLDVPLEEAESEQGGRQICPDLDCYWYNKRGTHMGAPVSGYLCQCLCQTICVALFTLPHVVLLSATAWATGQGGNGMASPAAAVPMSQVWPPSML